MAKSKSIKDVKKAGSAAEQVAPTVKVAAKKVALKKVTVKEAAVKKAAVKRAAVKKAPTNRQATAAKAEPKAVPTKSAKPEVKKPLAKPARTVKPEKTKVKLVRDSFTMPQEDWALIQVLKDRALGFKRPVKKSELLRAGLQALSAMSDEVLLAALGKLVALKPGRPKA